MKKASASARLDGVTPRVIVKVVSDDRHPREDEVPLAAKMAVSLAPQLDAVRAAAQIDYVSALCTVRRADSDQLVVGIIGPWPFDESTSEGWQPKARRRRKGDEDEEHPYDEELDEDLR